MQAAGSRLEVLQMKDSQFGPKDQSFGSDAGEFLPYHTLDFWLNLALCHALLVEDVNGEAVYQARPCLGLASPGLQRSSLFGMAIPCALVVGQRAQSVAQKIAILYVHGLAQQ
jgi:hypothetical protein